MILTNLIRQKAKQKSHKMASDNLKTSKPQSMVEHCAKHQHLAKMARTHANVPFDQRGRAWSELLTRLSEVGIVDLPPQPQGFPWPGV